MSNGNLAQMIADELIAITFVVCFLGTSMYLVVSGNYEGLKIFAAVISPFVGTIVAFYFAKRNGASSG